MEAGCSPTSHSTMRSPFYSENFIAIRAFRRLLELSTAFGPELKRVWPSKREVWPFYPDFGKPSPIWSAGGDTEETFEVAAGSTLETVGQQMLRIFESRTCDSVGPPFKFVERHRDRKRNRNWEVTPP